MINDVNYFYERSDDIVDKIRWEYIIQANQTISIYPKDKEDLPCTVKIPDEIDGYMVSSIYCDAFSYCETLEEVILPADLIEVMDNAFFHCISLNSVQFFEKINKIGDWAFAYCPIYSLDNLPEGLETISDYAFYKCERLRSVHFPESLRTIGDFSFSECISLESLDLPKTLTEIKTMSFSKCRNLKDVTLEEGTTAIFDYQFYQCNELKNIKIPHTVVSIGRYAFAYCDKLDQLIISAAVSKIGEKAFLYVNPSIITIPRISVSEDTGIDLEKVIQKTPQRIVFHNPYSKDFIRYTYRGDIISDFPIPPERPGYFFDGWYQMVAREKYPIDFFEYLGKELGDWFLKAAQNAGKRFTPETVVENSIDLYAHWRDIEEG